MNDEKKSESKVLGRSIVELTFDNGAGKMTRKEAVAMVARQLGVAEENVGLVRMEGQSGTTSVVGKFFVYGSAESKLRLHPRHLGERMLSKGEREKLKQERKKAAAPAPAAEAK